MIGTIANYIYGIAVLAFIVYVVIWNVIHLIYWIKCFRVKTCYNRKCMFGICCDKQVDVFTKEEFDALMEMIERKREELKEKHAKNES